MLRAVRPSSVKRGNVLVPASSDPALAETQEEALAQVREKLKGRRESCTALVLSASTLSKTVMVTQLQSRGWNAVACSHMVEASAMLRQQIAKAHSRGLSVARDGDVSPVGGPSSPTAAQYNAAGFRIKFADDDAVTRLILVDSFTHETLRDIVRHIRAVDDEYKLKLIICFLTTPRPTEGQGYVLAPVHVVSLGEAYASGVDLVIPTHFDKSTVDLLTELFLSSTGRYLKNIASSSTTSNFSQIRSLLMDVTDRNRLQVTLHETEDLTGGVPGLEGFMMTGKQRIDDDNVEEEVTNAQKREALRREERRKAKLAANTIDTNPEYISLLSKYEVALRQLSANKDRMHSMAETIEQLSTSSRTLEEDKSRLEAELESSKQLLLALQEEEEVTRQQQGNKSYYAQLVQREQRIAQLEKEATAFRSKFESTKKIADDAFSKIDKLRKELDDSKKHAVNINKRFEARLRALGVTGAIDLDGEAERQTDAMSRLKDDVDKWRWRVEMMRCRLEARETADMLLHDTDCVGKTAHAFIDGLGQIVSRDDLAFILNQRKAHLMSTPPTSSVNTRGGGQIDETATGLPHLHDNESDGDHGGVEASGRISVISVNSALEDDDERDRSDGNAGAVDDDRRRSRKADDILNAFSVLQATQFSDMSAPSGIDREGEDRAFLDRLVQDAKLAVSEGDAIIHASVEDRQRAADDRRYSVGSRRGVGSRGQGTMALGGAMSITPSTMETTGVGRLDPQLLSSFEEDGKQRTEVIVSSLSRVGQTISTELETLVTSVTKAEKRDAEARAAMEASFRDLMQIAHRRSDPRYEAALDKLMEYVQKQHMNAEVAMHQAPSASEDLHKAVTDVARWQVLLDEVEERLRQCRIDRDQDSHATKRRLELERNLELLEAKAYRLLPEMVATHNTTAYLANMVSILETKKALRSLPGGKLKGQRASLVPTAPPGGAMPTSPPGGSSALSGSLNASFSSAAATAPSVDVSTPQKLLSALSSPPTPSVDTTRRAAEKALDDLPLSVLELCEKAMTAELEASRAISLEVAQNVRRRSVAISDGLRKLQAPPVSGSLRAEQQVGGRSRSPVPRGDATSSQRDPFATLQPLSISLAGGDDEQPRNVLGPSGVTMSGVASEMIQRFRSYSTVKQEHPQPASHPTAAAPASSLSAVVKNLVGGVKSTLSSSIESMQNNVSKIHQDVVQQADHFVTGMSALGQLDFTAITDLFERTKAIPTPQTLYPLLLAFHKDLIRLLKQIRRRTSLTSVNIVDAHHLQRQLLRDHKPLTKAQIDNIPFIISVDAAQVARFADYFEHETEGLLREGITRLQRYIDESAAKELHTGVVPRSVVDAALAPPTIAPPRKRRGSQQRGLGSDDEVMMAMTTPGDSALVSPDEDNLGPIAGGAEVAKSDPLDLDVAPQLGAAAGGKASRSQRGGKQPSVVSTSDPVSQQASAHDAALLINVPVTTNAEEKSASEVLLAHSMATPRPSLAEVQLVHQALLALPGPGAVNPPASQSARLGFTGVKQMPSANGPPASRAGAVPVALSTTLFGSTSANTELERYDIHERRVVYTPRMPTALLGNSSLARRAGSRNTNSPNTAKSRYVAEVVQQLATVSAGCGRGQFPPSLPPPSRPQPAHHPQ